jgi:hypothetical protein
MKSMQFGGSAYGIGNSPRLKLGTNGVCCSSILAQRVPVWDDCSPVRLGLFSLFGRLGSGAAREAEFCTDSNVCNRTLASDIIKRLALAETETACSK